MLPFDGRKENPTSACEEDTIARLKQAGYSISENGNRITVQFNDQTKATVLKGKGHLCRLQFLIESPAGQVHEVRMERPKRGDPGRKFSKRPKRVSSRSGKEIVTSAKVSGGSAETRRVRYSSGSKSRYLKRSSSVKTSQGGLPSLGKHR
jgi:hypothetical protein